MMCANRLGQRVSVCTVVVLALLGASTEAHADDSTTKDECIAANESAQALRRTGNLQRARIQLLICTAESCPGPVRDDCSERLNELDKAIPTVVFTAKAPDQTELAAVTVTVDGLPLVERLDGSAVSVEPGEHIFELTTAGYPPVSRTLIIHEGVRARQEVFLFASRTATGEGTAAAGIEPPSLTVREADQQPRQPSRSAQKSIGFVAGAVGLGGIAVGAFFGLRASSKWSSAKSACVIDHCGPGSEAQRNKVDASTAGTISTVAFVVGAASVVAGATLLVLASAPTSKPTSTARLSLSRLVVTPQLNGIAATGEFW